jgi:Ca2+-binding RTX toxin-like protein
VFEGNESVIATISSAITNSVTLQATSGGSLIATGTLIDTDATGTGSGTDQPTVSIAVNPTSMGEDDATGVLTYTVTLSNESAFDTVVTYALSGTANAANDYTVSGTSGTLTIAAGALTGTFTVDPTSDTVFEGNESVIATISSAITNSVTLQATSGGSLIATGTINDDSDIPTIISVGDVGGFGSNVTVDEGALAVFLVTMSNASSIATPFSLALTAGTTQGAFDYTALNGAATLAYTDAMKFSNGVTLSGDGQGVIVPAGVTSFTVTVRTVNDAIVEPNETFNLAVGGTVGIGTIIDNDGPPSVAHIGDPTGSFNNVTVAEGVAAVFTVNLSHAGTTATSFALALVDGTANLTSDYTSAMTFSDGVTISGGNITVPIGVISFTVTVPTVNNLVFEPTENFTLQIGSATGTGTITDNDPAPIISHVGNPAGTVNEVTVMEGVAAVFTVNLSNASSTSTSFDLALSNGSALLGDDYTNAMVFSTGASYNSTTGLVTVGPGVTSFTVTVPTVDDNVREHPETFILSIGGVAGIGNITDNETGSLPPPNPTPGGQTTLEDVALVFNTANGNAITVAADVTTTTLSVGSGTLTAQPVTGATITTNASGSVTIAGTATAINGALNGLVYTPVADYNGSVVLMVASNNGTTVSTNGIVINVTPVADITNNTAAFTPTSTDFCDTVPSTPTGPVLSAAHDTYTVASAVTDTVILGLGGNDTITTTSLTTSSNSIKTLGGNDIITTTTVDGKNVVCAGDGDNTITTTVTGIGGNFVGMGSGNDTMTTTNVNGDNLILGGDGNNTITTTTTGTGNTKVVTGDGNDTITTTNVGFGTSTVLSGAGNDTITTGAGADLVVSGAGNDTVTTTGGNDIVFAGAGNDTVTTGEGNDIVLGGGGDDIIAAGAGDDIVFGGDGDDKINAGAGADIIDSGAGNDIIRLGLDAEMDTVIFGANAAANGSDTITQFTSGTDKLNLAAMTTQTATTAVTGNLTVTAGSVYFLNATGPTDASTLALSATALQGGATWTNASNGTVAFFVVSAANGSAIYQYTESGAAGITAGELTLMGTIDTTIAVGDLVFVANTAAAAALATAVTSLEATADATSVSSLTIDVLANDSFENTGKVITAINGSAITDGGAAVAVSNGSVALLAGQLVYTPTLVTYNGVASFKYTVTSGGVNETAWVSVQVGPPLVGAQNPVNTVPSAAYTLLPTDLLTFSAANGNAITVADADSLLLTTTLSVGSGTLTAVTAGGAALITGNGTSSLSIAGTAAEINFALNGLSYARAPGNTSAVSMTVVTSDGALTDSDTIALVLPTHIVGATNAITIGAGDNYVVLGTGGNDAITVGAGANNLVFGGDGNDSLTIGAGASTVYGGAGDDTFAIGVGVTAYGGDGNDTFAAAAGNFTIDGGAGNDTITAAAGTSIITGGDGDDTIVVAAGNSIITGGAGADNITLGAGNGTIDGGAGNDTINAAAGVLVYGGDGDDAINLTTSNTAYGGAGNDTFTAPAGNYFIYAGDGDDTVNLGAGNNTIDVGEGINNITVGAGNMTITGGADKDTITTGAGDYIINAGDGDNVIWTGAAATTSRITTGAGNDTITTGGGSQIINSGAGNDTIVTSTGADTMTGGAGNDTMTGGAGADVFKWSLGETGSDVIKDFTLAGGGDRLDLRDLLTGEIANAASLDAYLDFSANAAGQTLISVDANGTAAGGTGQTITLENITFADLQAHAVFSGTAGSASDVAIITKLLAESNLVTSP